MTTRPPLRGNAPGRSNCTSLGRRDGARTLLVSGPVRWRLPRTGGVGHCPIAIGSNANSAPAETGFSS
jgi:hypothetical protein